MSPGPSGGRNNAKTSTEIKKRDIQLHVKPDGQEGEGERERKLHLYSRTGLMQRTFPGTSQKRISVTVKNIARETRAYTKS